MRTRKNIFNESWPHNFNIDKIIHEPVRLVVLQILYFKEYADYKFLKEALNVTEGNLLTHLRRLEDSGYIRIEKRFVGRRPNTRYYMTETGRKAFQEYVTSVDDIIAVVVEDVKKIK